MKDLRYPSEVRDSQIRMLIDRVRKQNYARYLLTLRLEKIRLFRGVSVRFDFPVTAVIGPNGGGKSTILGAVACAYGPRHAEDFFPRNAIGDDLSETYSIECELVDKKVAPKGTTRLQVTIGEKAEASMAVERDVRHFNVSRTLPAIENSRHTKRMMRDLKPAILTTLAGGIDKKIESLAVNDVASFEETRTKAQAILGGSLDAYRLVEVDIAWHKPTLNQPPANPKKAKRYHPVTDPLTGKVRYTILGRTIQQMLVGKNGAGEYSEFNFGAGESSVLRLVHEVETLPDYSLVLIEELENGLHPVATRRLVEYLIGAAERKKIQVIFTTHSDAALGPLPPEAIWAAINGGVQQGKLSIESLRAITGRIDRQLAIFVEDDFARHWIESILREAIGARLDAVGVYPLSGDGNAVRTHLAHRANPAVTFDSICVLDGDSTHPASAKDGIHKLPGTVPESTIFDAVLSDLHNNIAMLTIACQRSPSRQADVAATVRNVAVVCRDPHNLFSRLGLELGFLPEAIVRGAFLSLWLQKHAAAVDHIVKAVDDLLLRSG